MALRLTEKEASKLGIKLVDPATGDDAPAPDPKPYKPPVSTKPPHVEMIIVDRRHKFSYQFKMFVAFVVGWLIGVIMGMHA